MGYIGAGITRFNTADELTVTGTSEFGGNVSFGDNNITNVGSLQIDSIAGDADTNTNITFAGSDVITMTTAGSERVRVDASGNVGIGTASPNSYSGYTALTLDNATNGGIIDIERNGTLVGEMFTSDANTFTLAAVGSKAFTVNTNSAERMRIDSSGNVLVGKTSADSNSVGIELHSNDIIKIARSGGSTGYFNRKTNDGSIIEFAKDGTTVGSISTSNSNITIGNGGAGIKFTGSINLLEPWTPSSNSASNGAIDIGYSSGRFKDLHLSGSVYADLIRHNGDTDTFIQWPGNNTLAFNTGGSERMRIDSSGRVLVGKTTNDFNTAGINLRPVGAAEFTRDADEALLINRTTNDGVLVRFYQAGTGEGTISVSGTTVSYNGGHLARFSQATDGNRITGLVKGTVMTNLDQMAVWTKDGVTEDNEQLNCMAVSSVEGDANVAGVFVNWDDDDEDYTADMNIAMTGDMVIRIAGGTTVARGDLLMSAGDGTAKPQGDDIVRSKTIAKVTSTTVSHTYDDGTFLVPCVLMAC